VRFLVKCCLSGGHVGSVFYNEPLCPSEFSS
jgi:hypothetical protein